MREKVPYICNMKKAAIDVMDEIPSSVDTEKTLSLIQTGRTKAYFVLLKRMTNEDDKEMSEWLDISVKTLRNYRKTQKAIKESIKEHLIMLLSLMKHGTEVFGDYMKFKQWLDKKHPYFDGKAPGEFITSISGMKFIDDRLTAMEYGDNA